jgi:adenosylhomocysteinase
MRALAAGGAERACAPATRSPPRTRCRALAAEYGIPTFAIKGRDNDTYYKHMRSDARPGPQVTMDDGAIS